MSMQNRDQSNNAGSRPTRGPMGRGGGMGHMGGMMRGEKAHDFKGHHGEADRVPRPYRVSILVVLIIAACSTVFSILGPRSWARRRPSYLKG